MLQLTFLGTSAGVPTKQRNVTALAIECLNPYFSSQNQSRKKSRPWLLIDCGEGTQQQLLQTKLSLHQLTAICITHVHGDHCYGLPGLLASSAMSGRTAPLTIIAPKAIDAFLTAIQSTTELHFTFAIDFIAIEDILSNKNIAADDSKQSSDDTNEKTVSSQMQNDKIKLALDNQHELEIDITKLSHRVASHAFEVTQTISQRVLDTDKLKAAGIPASQLWGQLQQGHDVYLADGQQLLSAEYVDNNQRRTRIVVAGDNDRPELLNTAVKNADLLIHEATYTNEIKARILAKMSSKAGFDPMHSSAQQVAQFAKDSGLQNLILTHFSARYQNFDNPNSDTANMSHLRLEAEAFYQGNLWLAEDFAQYLVAGQAVTAKPDRKSDSHPDSTVQYLGLIIKASK
ncbi:MBL fold metallo-hydrolase [Psychrobacter sp. 2Y5]|uniref:MBL fold metallo-hydrolase n=1 Tax=unclassified Psychrobacter TaxID=196806 RepID=UPI003F48832A